MGYNPANFAYHIGTGPWVRGYVVYYAVSFYDATHSCSLSIQGLDDDSCPADLPPDACVEGTSGTADRAARSQPNLSADHFRASTLGSPLTEPPAALTRDPMTGSRPWRRPPRP
jgi:hypothetical protein